MNPDLAIIRLFVIPNSEVRKFINAEIHEIIPIRRKNPDTPARISWATKIPKASHTNGQRKTIQ